MQSSRITEILAMGSVPVMQDATDSEFLTPLLVPWEHYVPIRQDLSDLVPKLQYVLARPTLGEKIADQALALWRERVSRKDTLCYLYRALASIQQLTSIPDEASAGTDITPEEMVDKWKYVLLPREVTMRLRGRAYPMYRAFFDELWGWQEEGSRAQQTRDEL